MTIASGTKIGPYEITGAIGAGGMGEVYRARDAKLGRDVALKVLPEAFARDAERMARFQREAKVLASLNHPNIAAIYGLEDSGNTHALVMELVGGPTLADRIKSGPIPVDEALRVAKQICDGLEYAHERGIVHRDLKPANVKVTKDDAVKILDFGLAKALEGDAASVDISTSPTISRMATMQGVLLGTAAYMSPEQAKGKAVDRRADIWAFGCVLYEMLTGKQTFTGDTVTDTLAAVIRAEPDWSQLPAATPIRVRVLLQRCLQKDPKQRLQAIGEARIALDEVLSGAPDPAPTAAAASVSRQLWITRGVATGFIVAFAALAFAHFREKPVVPTTPPQRYEIVAAAPTPSEVSALSPDGTRLVLGGFDGNRLWLRRMDSLEAHPIEGTDGAYGVPFWSPDSRFIAFSTLQGKLKKIDTEGGPAQVVCDSGRDVFSGFWTPDGKIVFGDPARQPGLWEVPATGGVPSPLPGVEHAGDTFRYGPVLLPDGKHFLYSSGGPASADVYLGSLDSRPGQESSKKLLTGVFNNARYAPSPNDPDLVYLLFVRDGSTRTLVAQPFDLGKLELVGEAIPIAERVSDWNFSASLTGTLVYLSSPQGEADQLTLFDRQGKILGTAGEPGIYINAALSPDGKRVAAARGNPQSGVANLWLLDLSHGISTRFTFDAGVDQSPVWSPDGSRIVFSSEREGTSYHLYQKLSNGGGDDELLFKWDSGGERALSWSDDGRFLLFGVPVVTAAAWVLPLDGNARAASKPFLFAEQGVVTDARFSPGPHGRPLWVAYSSNESGRSEVYVRPFDTNSPNGTPPGGGKWQVSTQGGVSPRWNSNGRELFYVALDGTVMSVEASGGNGVFQSGIPKPLFRPNGPAPQVNDYFDWDASSDGKKFIFAVSPPESATAPPARFTVMLNWQAGLKK